MHAASAMIAADRRGASADGRLQGTGAHDGVAHDGVARYAPQGAYTGGACMCTSAALLWAVACATRMARPQCPARTMRVLMTRAATTHLAITERMGERSTHMLQQHEVCAFTCRPVMHASLN